MAESITNKNRSLMYSLPFLQGLNTELNGIVDSSDFTKDELNVMIRGDNTRSRRPGVDFETNYTMSEQAFDVALEDLAFNSTEWTDINSPDESENYLATPYLVVQVGGKVLFYENRGLPFSQAQAFTLDLAEHRLDPEDDVSYKTEKCRFTTAYGCLFIASKAIHPILCRSAQEITTEIPDTPEEYPSGILPVTAFQGKHQRMGGWGGYVVTSLDGLKPIKKYLDAFYEFYIGGVRVGKFDYTGPCPNSYTMAQSFNSLSADIRRNLTAVPFESQAGVWTNPNTGWPNMTPYDFITIQAEDNSVRGLEVSVRLTGHAYKSGSWVQRDFRYNVNLTGGSARYRLQTKLDLVVRDTSYGAEDFLAVDENPKKLSYAHLYNLLNQGWTAELIGKFYQKSRPKEEAVNRFFPGNNLAQQYLKDGQLDAFKPEALINMTFGNTPAARGHFKLSFFNQDRNTIASLSLSMLAVVDAINDARRAASETGDDITLQGILETPFPVDPEDPAAQVPVVKPRKPYVTDLQEYAGRVFYLCDNTLLYSQVLAEDLTKASQCCSEADPTSEEMSDVIETDGGTLSIPEIGEGVKLSQLGPYLLVFGTRGNVYLSGTANNLFTATAYTKGTLPVAPTHAPHSFVTTEFGLFYWGSTSINMIGFGGDGLAPTDLSTDRLLNFYGRISKKQQENCKGVYSSSKKKVFWFYPSDESKPRRLDSVLVYDIRHNAFTPYKIATTAINTTTGEAVDINAPEVVSGLSLSVPFKSIKAYPLTAEGPYFEKRYTYRGKAGDAYTFTYYTTDEDPGVGSVVIQEGFNAPLTVDSVLSVGILKLSNGALAYRYPEGDYTQLVETDDNYEVTVDDAILLADDPIESEEFAYESSTLVCFSPSQGKITFGDFNSNLLRDWVTGDTEGNGYTFDSYLISHPMSASGYTTGGTRATDFAHNKNMPYLLTYFRRTETGKTINGGYVYPSGCIGSAIWDWKTAGNRGGWDAPQQLYRPNVNNLLFDGYVITKTNIRGIGRSFQVKLQSQGDKQFILEALAYDLLNDGRI